MNYSINALNNIVKGKLLALAEDVHIQDVLIDSRKYHGSTQQVFFAIRGERHNGHNFVHTLYEKGLRNFVVSEPEALGTLQNCNVILVENVLDAFQNLAKHHRSCFFLPVIGITGSNGKTIVKEWLHHLLKQNFLLVKSPKSYNSQVGVPLSVLQLNTTHEVAIFEAGISLPEEMGRLEKMIQPTIGVFTNIGEAHAAAFSDIKEKTKEKFKLFRHVDFLVYGSDDPIVASIAEAFIESSKRFSWSLNKDADLRILAIKSDLKNTAITGVSNEKTVTINIPFTDKASIQNAITCWAVLMVLKIEPEIYQVLFDTLGPVEMRLEMKEGINNTLLINDYYNSDFGSLSIALDYMSQQKQHAFKTLILSDFLQIGKSEKDFYKDVAKLLHEKGVSKIIGIGEALCRYKDCFRSEKQFYPNTASFIEKFDPHQYANQTILIKGARLFEFEKIGSLLQQKTHETTLTVNMNALINNFNYFKNAIPSKGNNEVKMMVMVKAFGYGSGAYEVASLLEFQRADYLAVAYADEGVELRTCGITLPIMVMNPDAQSFNSMLQYNLEPEIYNYRTLSLLEEAIASRNESSDKPVLIHLKLDTGMHRLGFEEADLDSLVSRLKANKCIKIISVFSHLVASDEPEHDSFTQQQIHQFERMSSKLITAFDHKIMRHILNSAGIVRFPQACFDMVRLGIGLYGIGLGNNKAFSLENVSTLKTSISQIKNIPKGETIGYSRKGVANKDLRIATIPIGYADGLSRRLSNGKGNMLVKGIKVPIIGNVCMDMCMLDISGVDATEGDEVIIFGNDLPVSDMAAACETIPYEILTNISRRVKRIYLQE